MRKKFAEICKRRIAEKDDLFVLLGDIGVGAFLTEDELLYPHVMNMGIAEQALVCFAAGLNDATKKNVIVHTISSFLVERAFEQIKNCLGYNERKVILVSANGPFDYEKLGPTHHCPNDVNLIAMIDGLDIFLPSFADEVPTIFDLAFASSRSSYIRLTSRVREELTPAYNGLSWNRCYLNGKKTRVKNARKIIPDLTVIALGESVTFALDQDYGDKTIELIYGSMPLVPIDRSLVSCTDVLVLEPYVAPLIKLNGDTSGLNITRRNFSGVAKKVITSNLGWEDFRL